MLLYHLLLYFRLFQHFYPIISNISLLFVSFLPKKYRFLFILSKYNILFRIFIFLISYFAYFHRYFCFNSNIFRHFIQYSFRVLFFILFIFDLKNFCQYSHYYCVLWISLLHFRFYYNSKSLVAYCIYMYFFIENFIFLPYLPTNLYLHSIYELHHKIFH